MCHQLVEVTPLVPDQEGPAGVFGKQMRADLGHLKLVVVDDWIIVVLVDLLLSVLPAWMQLRLLGAVSACKLVFERCVV